MEGEEEKQSKESWCWMVQIGRMTPLSAVPLFEWFVACDEAGRFLFTTVFVDVRIPTTGSTGTTR